MWLATFVEVYVIIESISCLLKFWQSLWQQLFWLVYVVTKVNASFEEAYMKYMYGNYV
jgi:hypothetical protein